MNYQDSIRFLYDLQFHGIKLGLDNCKAFLKHVGADKPKSQIIHIAGTNGKGSTAQFIHAILTNHRKHVGLFTSPHLYDFRERIKVDDHLIEANYIAEFVKSNAEYISQNKLTFFEVNTVLAVRYFIDQDVDYIILETGLGGRLDATNCFENTIAHITNISLDHTEYLGESLAEICAEKCGIIKKDSVVFTAETKPKLQNQIKLAAEQAGSDFKLIEVQFNRDGSFSVENVNYFITQGGDYQKLNAASALMISNYILNDFDAKTAANAIKYVTLPGRLEVWDKNERVILDVSHNQEGVKLTINELLKKYKDKSFAILFTLLDDKAIAEIIDELKRLSSDLFLYPINNPRFDQKMFEPFQIAEYDKSDSIETFRQENQYDYILVIGSHYLMEQFAEQNQNL